MAKRIVIFNHKGGVSKTTTVYNLGWMLAKKFKVLVVDADSQCNLTSLVLQDNFEKYYIDDVTKQQNLKDGVAPAFKGKPIPIEAVNCFSPQRAPSMFLLAGHADLSEYEANLTFAQTNAISTLQNLPGAFSELLRLTEEKYSIDFTIIDLNPSLSSINQNLFLSTHAFILPTNPDPFSIMALNTLQTILPRWSEWKKNAVNTFSDTAYPLLPGVPKFCGSIIQRFNIRNGRAARPYRDNIQEIKDRLADGFVDALQNSGMTLTPEQYGPDLVKKQYCLAEIPDFQGLLPKSHEAGVPVFELTDQEIGETGPVLVGLQQKRELFKNQFEVLAEQISSLVGHA
jgi:cellulose biosynthesis protein BcsQ